MSTIHDSLQNPAGEVSSYTAWREHFLQIVLRAASILGFVALILHLFSPVALLWKLVAVLGYAILVAVTWSSRVAYTLRAGTFLILLYVAGCASLVGYGFAEGGLLLLGFVVLASLLAASREAAYYAVGLSLLGILLAGRQGTSWLEWARAIGIFLMVAFTAAFGLRTAVLGFLRTEGAAQQVLDTLLGERFALEQRIEERTAGLTLKTEQLRATSYIARQTAEVQDLDSLLTTVAKLVSDQFGFYHTGIFLLNQAGNQAVLHAASSEGGRHMIEQGYAQPLGTQSIVGSSVIDKKPRIALDIGEDPVFFNNPDLPMTRSEIALPLIVRNKVLGVMDLQSDRPQAFSSDDIDIFQTLADQVAIAIENTRLMDETQAALLQLEALTRLRTREAWSQKLNEGHRAFSYTPLGLRAEKVTQDPDKTVKAAIMLRGQKIGDISIARKGESTWNKSDRELIDEVASQVGLAVDNIRLLEEATQRARQEQTVGRLASRFSQSLDLDTLLQTAARELGQLPDISEVSVFIGEDPDQTVPPPLKRRVS
jgi:GAF domain-containing protein